MASAQQLFTFPSESLCALFQAVGHKAKKGHRRQEATDSLKEDPFTSSCFQHRKIISSHSTMFRHLVPPCPGFFLHIDAPQIPNPKLAASLLHFYSPG